MKLKFFIPIFIFLSLISCKSDKKNPTEAANIPNKSQDSIRNLENKQADSYFNFQKWNSVVESTLLYKQAGFSVQINSNFNKSKNLGGRSLLVNNKEIDFIISDAYVFTPYLFVDKNEKILLLKEEDEGGIYGFMMYYFENDKFTKKEYLDIAPEEEGLPIEKFIRFKNQSQEIIPIIIPKNYYDTKTDQLKIANQFIYNFSKKANLGKNSNKANKKTECKELTGDMMSGKECIVHNVSLENAYQEIKEQSLVTDAEFLLTELPQASTSKTINKNGIIEISYKVNQNSVIIEMIYEGGVTDIELHKQNDSVKRIIRYNYD